MKKHLLTLLLSGLALSGFAQVTPATGAVEPQTSTADNPVWYAMMSSHLTQTERQNRWMYYDGTTLGTTQFTADGLGADVDVTDYAWRLEAYNDGYSDGVRLIHYDGMEVMVPATAEGVANTPLQMVDGVGSLWNLMLSSETGQAQCAANQYVLDYVYATMSEYLFLNALDGTSAGLDWGITVFNAGAHQASGWFFVPLTIEEGGGEEPGTDDGWQEVCNYPMVANSVDELAAMDNSTVYTNMGACNESDGSTYSLLDGYSCSWFLEAGYKPYADDFIAAAFEVEETGTYYFSFLTRLVNTRDLNAGSANVELRYTDVVGTDWNYAGSKFGGELASDALVVDVPSGNTLLEGNEIELSAGVKYYFAVNVTANASDNTRLLVGDFHLYKKGDVQPVETYPVTWETPANGTLTVTTAEGELVSGTEVEAGTELTITATPGQGYTLASLTVNDAPFTSGETYVVEGVTVIAVAFEAEQTGPSWGVPGGTTHSTESRYVTSASTTGAVVDLAYTNPNAANALYTDTQAGMTVQQGQSFDLNVVSTDQMVWCHAVVWVDWNCDGDFDDEGEELFKVGSDVDDSDAPGDLVSNGNTEVSNFTRTITVPETATVATTRMRVQYTDAWHIKGVDHPAHSAMDDIDKGGVWDFDVTITEAPVEPEWVVFYTDTVGANSRNGQNWDMDSDPYYHTGWTKVSNSASALLQLVQSNNNWRFGPYLSNCEDGAAFAVKVAGLEPGKYKFSYLHKAGATGGTAMLKYGTEFNSNLIDASEEVDIPKKGGPDAGDLIESNEFEITEAGDYYFHYVIATGASGLKVRIGDFYLYKLEVPAVTYTVTWEQPENGTLAVFNGETELTSPATVEEGTELTITATPAEGYQLEAITVAGEPLEGSTWTVDGDATIAATFTLAPVDPNTAIQMFGATASGKEPNHNRFSFDDDLLGSHVNGSRDNDQRSYSFTMSAWVKVNEARGRVMGYGQKGWWGPGPTFNLYIENDAYHLYNRQRATDGGVNDGQDESVNQAVEVGEWAFLTVVFDEEAGTRTFYYNGEQKFTGSYTQEGLGMLQDESEFYIIDGLNEGNANYTNDPALDLDEVQVWTKALTADEVAASMNEVDPSADGLAYLYRFGAERMNEDFTFNNLATSAAVTSQVTGAYMTGTIEYSAAVYTSVLSGSVVEPTFVPGRKATPTPEPEMYTISWEEVEGVTFDAYDWNNQETHYNSGDQVKEGTQVVLTATANEGWVLDGMTVNGEEFNQSLVAVLGGQNPVTVTEDLVVSATAHQLVTYAVTFSVENPELGELEVRNAYTGEPLTSGDEVEEGTMLEINMFPEADVTSEVYINDELVATITSDEVDPDYGGCWYNVDEVTEDLDILVRFVAESVEPEQYTVTWEGDNCTFEVYTSGLKWISNGQLVDAGTEIFIDVKTADGFTLESLTVNGEEFEEGGLYVVNSDTHIVATAVGTGINAVAVNGAYYDADAEVLYVDGEQALKLYDVTGRMVVDTEVDGTFSMAGLKDGIYMAVVDGKVLKFRK